MLISGLSHSTAGVLKLSAVRKKHKFIATMSHFFITLYCIYSMKEVAWWLCYGIAPCAILEGLPLILSKFAHLYKLL